jgi:23S rRNA pseudoU1915 N3-methylase RlmH
MSFNEKLLKLIDEELDEKLNSAINEYAKIISEKHGIYLKDLLKDIPESYSNTFCKGTKNNGERCGFKASENGYCKHHKLQGERICQRIFATTSNHNHGPETMFVIGCPGCQNKKELIDLDNIIL